MSTKRMLPSNTAHTTTVINGRTYTAVAGTTVDVPQWNADELGANGWFDVAGLASVGSGTTAARPTTGLVVGSKYLDTTLAYIVVYDGATWRNPSSGASV